MVKQSQLHEITLSVTLLPATFDFYIEINNKTGLNRQKHTDYNRHLITYMRSDE